MRLFVRYLKLSDGFYRDRDFSDSSGRGLILRVVNFHNTFMFRVMNFVKIDISTFVMNS